MLEPDNQKVYFTSDDLSELYPGVEDPQKKALDATEYDNGMYLVIQ